MNRNRFKIFYLVPCLVLLLGLYATGFEPIRIVDFSGGLNTVMNPRLKSIDTRYADACENFYLYEGGSMGPRPGYHALTGNLADHEKIWGLHGHKYPNGKGILFQLLKRSDTDWCDVYASNPFSYSADDSLGSYIYPGAPIWVSWLDNVYLFNGVNRPKKLVGGPDDLSMIDIIPLSTSSLRVIPIAEPGNPYGEFVYCIATRDIVHGNNRECYYGSFTDPVFADSNKIILRDFGTLSCNNFSDTVFDIFILKCRPNRHDHQKDSLFILDSLADISNETLDTLTYTDDHAGDFSASDYFTTFASIDGLLMQAPSQYQAIGQPDILTCNYGTIDHDKWILSPGGYQMVKYVMLLYDSTHQTYSDTCRHTARLRLNSCGTDTVFNIRLWIPPSPNDRYSRIIYRSCRTLFGIDSAWTAFYSVDTIAATAGSLFVDNKPHDSIMLYGEVLPDISIPGRLNGAIIHEGRMYGWDDHYVYLSQTGTSGQWQYYDVIEFDLDDGDRILNLVSYEGFVVVYKTRSIYILYTSDGFVTHRSKKSAGVGMIAPNSLFSYNGANIFLGPQGVNFEVGSAYKNQSLDRRRLSDNIENLVVRDIDDMTSAAAIAWKDFALLSYPGTDSTFVFFFDRGGWMPWSFDFLDACLYDTLKRSEYTTFGDLIFIQDDDERIFKLDFDDTTDAGADFDCYYQKSFSVPGANRIIPQRLDLWRSASVQDTATVTFIVKDGRSNPLDTLTMDSLNYRFGYRFVSPNNNKSANYISVEMTVTARDSLRIDELGIYLDPAGINVRR